MRALFSILNRIISFYVALWKDIPAAYDSYKVARPVPDSDIEYFDEDGNPVSEEEAMTRTITDPEGNVIGSYIPRNESVWSVRVAFSDGKLLPITVSTRDQIVAAQQKINHLNSIFVIIYIIEAAAAILIYFSKRVKY